MWLSWPTESYNNANDNEENRSASLERKLLIANFSSEKDGFEQPETVGQKQNSREAKRSVYGEIDLGRLKIDHSSDFETRSG